jgi:hypothetical protein
MEKRIVELIIDAQAHPPNEFIEICERISYGESFNEARDDVQTKSCFPGTEQ